MQSKLQALLSIIVVGTLSACATTNPGSSGTSGGELSQWVENEGAVYISEQLTTDPRFTGARIQLVQMDDDQITADVDQLSSEIRRQLQDTVLRSKGVNLMTRPAVLPWRAQRTLAEVDCGIIDPLTHVVGIDMRNTLSGDYRLSIKAVDLSTSQLVSGFEKSWAGNLNSAQEAALQQDEMDITLRGLRPLPFGLEQPDLTASYLAQNLSCLLRQGALSRMRIYIEPLEYGTHPYFEKVNALMGRYMNQYREVDLVSDISQANAIVNSETVKLTTDLWQMWIGVAFTENGLQVSGVDTPAYIKLDPASGHDDKPVLYTN